MAILSGDVKLLKSANMADVPEGGGRPTGNEIADGVSNAIFPDISELDRAGGRVSLRKVFPSVKTDDHDTYFGANVIVAEPPQDPRVSVTIFSTGDVFDTRAQASSRVESYLNKGAEWSGYLYENHIAGQRVIQLFQRVTDLLPNVGQTLCLVENEGKSNQIEQYVRATAVSSVTRTFTYGVDIDYQANVVTIDISDALRTDFTGSPASRTFTRLTASTKTRDTVVADAGTYVGVSPLLSSASLGDFTVNAQSMFTQLVPSAQTETPMTDMKPNGDLAIYSAAGGPFTLTTSVDFSTSASIAVGQGVLPGSLSITVGGATLTDSGGLLVAGTQQVGLVDYGQGIFSITDSSVSYPGAKTVTYTPAAAPIRALNTAGWDVTQESRSGTYVAIIDPPPAPGTTAVSYMAQGRWYTMRDEGNGQIKSAQGSFGTGTVNYTTGSMVVSLAALPDVGTKVLLTYGLPTTEKKRGGIAAKVQTRLQLANGGVAPSTVAISWSVNAVAKTAADNGAGLITGDATGTVDYINGTVILVPTLLPTAGTEFNVDYSYGEPIVENFEAPERMPDGSLQIPLTNPNILPRTVRVEWNTVYDPADVAKSKSITTTIVGRIDPIVTVVDNGSGGFATRPETAATINYVAGTIAFKPDTTIALPNATWKTVSIGRRAIGLSLVEDFKTVFDGYEYVNIGARFPDDLTGYVKVTYRTTAAGTSTTETIAFSPAIDLTAGFRDPIVPGSCTIAVGGTRYIDRQGSLVSAINYASGAGTNSGTINYSSGLAEFTVLNEGVANSGVIESLTTQQGPMPVMAVEFRTSAAPLRPGGFVVQFVVSDDESQTVHTVSADAQGDILTDAVVGKIDYETGVVGLRFGKWLPAAGNESEPWFDATKVQDGKIFLATAVFAETIRYAAVAYSYLPLDASILGIDPVRLPSDGRVPIFRPGGFAVVGHTGKVTATVSNVQTIDCARTRLSRVRIVGNDGVVINAGYSADLDAGTVTFDDVTGYSQPVTIEHRIEDMAVVREAQINGSISFTRALTHNYPSGSYVSSALVAGDLFARVQTVFDQATWNNTWTDAPSGASATGTFNDAQYPIVVTNRGALTERFVVRFTNTNAFEVIGEHVGVIANGNTSADCSPNNPASGAPYFTIPALGWGAGWATGNILRINTIGAEYPVWVVRTVQQGPETVTDDNFTLLVRGDVDTE